MLSVLAWLWRPCGRHVSPQTSRLAGCLEALLRWAARRILVMARLGSCSIPIQLAEPALPWRATLTLGDDWLPGRLPPPGGLPRSRTAAGDRGAVGVRRRGWGAGAGDLAAQDRDGALISNGDSPSCGTELGEFLRARAPASALEEPGDEARPCLRRRPAASAHHALPGHRLHVTSSLPAIGCSSASTRASVHSPSNGPTTQIA